MKNTPKGVLVGWTAVAGTALLSYLIGKEYTLTKLREYTKDNSVTNGGSFDNRAPAKEGELRRSVNRSL